MALGANPAFTAKPKPVRGRVAVGTMVWIGLVAGSLDIGENLIYNAFRHITPAMVFRYIASGLTGTRHAVAWGAAGVALGVAMHYLIALSWTAIYYAVSRRWRALNQRPVASGLGYGVIVFGIMNYAVLPLSRVPHPLPPMTPARLASVILPLLFCIGLTIALLVARAAPASRSSRDAGLL